MTKRNSDSARLAELRTNRAENVDRPRRRTVGRRAIVVGAVLLMVSAFAAAGAMGAKNDGSANNSAHRHGFEIRMALSDPNSPNGLTNDFRLLSFDWGLSGSGANGALTPDEVKITKPLDGATPLLLKAVANNEEIKEVVISLTPPGPPGAMGQTFTLTGAKVTHYSTHAGAMDSMELEQWSFTFRKIDVTTTIGKTQSEDNWSTEA